MWVDPPPCNSGIIGMQGDPNIRILSPSSSHFTGWGAHPMHGRVFQQGLRCVVL